MNRNGCVSCISTHKFKAQKKNELFHLNSFAGNMFGIGELNMDFDILRRIRRADIFSDPVESLLIVANGVKTPHVHRDNAMFFAPTYPSLSLSLCPSLRYL